MKIHQCAQGSGDWFALHVGIPTASQFDQLITPEGKRRTGEMPRTFAARLAGERFLQSALVDDFSTAFSDRGTMLEADAIPWYELTRDVDVMRVGFATLDDGSAGCSPDGLVGELGAIEVKCPAAISKSAQYIKSLVADEKKAAADYIAQIQGQIWICELDWCDLVFYHPELPKRVIRIYRDAEFIAELAGAVADCNAMAGEIFDELNRLAA